MAFLEHMVSVDGILVDSNKIEIVLEYHRLKKVEEVQSFLGLTGYYKWFTEGFVRLAQMLIKLTQNNVPFKWYDVCERSFQESKESSTLILVLALSIEGKDYDLHIDTYH